MLDAEFLHTVHQIEAMLFCAPGTQGSCVLRDNEVGSMSRSAFQVILARGHKAVEEGLTVSVEGVSVHPLLSWNF